MDKSDKKQILSIWTKYATQKEAVDAVRSFIKTKDGQTIDSTNQIDFDKLMALISCHPRFIDKFGDKTINAFKIVRGRYNNLTLFGLFNNGQIDISWRECAKNLARLQNGYALKTLEDEKINNLYRAMRNAIAPQEHAFKMLCQRPLISTISQQKLADKDADVDHYPKSFLEIADDWLKLQGVKTIKQIDEIKIRDTQDQQNGWEMTNPKQIHNWQNYHEKEAHYRIVSHHENISNKSYGYISMFRK